MASIGIKKLLRQHRLGFAGFANFRFECQRCQFGADGGAQETQHQRQHNGVGQSVGRVVETTQLVRNGMHISDIGAGKGLTRVVGGQRHLFTCCQITAIHMNHRQVNQKSC
jgi:hypothetical protein